MFGVKGSSIEKDKYWEEENLMIHVMYLMLLTIRANQMIMEERRQQRNLEATQWWNKKMQRLLFCRLWKDMFQRKEQQKR